jgi:hypothetical protein
MPGQALRLLLLAALVVSSMQVRVSSAICTPHALSRRHTIHRRA